MNVLLLYPEFPDTFWGFQHALKFIRKKASLPPLGLLTVGALLPAEWGRRLVDANVRRLTDADIQWADMVFIGGMIAQRDSARVLIARCRAAGRTIVAGGPLFSAEFEDFPEVDHFILDEAEMSLPPFLRDLAAGRPQRTYRSTEYADIGRSPVPAWELADLKSYASASVQYSRGCPFDCDFCNITMLFGHRPRVKSAEQVLEELERLHRLGWRDQVFFVDDNLIGNKRSLKEELLPALIAWRRKRPHLSFHTQASLNMARDPELLRLMAEAGFDTVFIGIETPDEAGLHECNKAQNRGRDMVADVARIRAAGLQVQGGFIVGFDSDTPGIFERQREFIQKSGIVAAMVGVLTAIPGTRLHDRLGREGRLLGRSSGNNVDASLNFVPRMRADTLLRGYRSLLRDLYSPGPYYRRVRAFLRDYRPPRVHLSIHWRDLAAFARSGLRLGILGPERFHYWHLLGWTFVRRPALFRLAVTLAIYGHHFRRACLPPGS